MVYLRLIKSVGLSILLLVATACVQPQTGEKDKIVAAVGRQKLYMSELSSLVRPEQPPGDSMTIVTTYMDQWLKRAAVIEEAEKKLSTSIDIERLVADYKASLLLSNYRQHIVQSRLDTSLTQEELAFEYELQRQNFILAEPIVKVRIAKVGRDKPSLNDFMKDWRNDNLQEIRTYCEGYAELYDLEDEWKSVPYIKALLPEGLIAENTLQSKGSTQKYKSGYEYFVKILEVVDEGEVPPLTYVENKIRDIIIHKRKKSVVAKMEQDIYDKALATNKVKVYEK